MENMPIIDLIHAISVAHTYQPKNFNNYSLKTYFMVCLIAMGPSSTLRSILTGGQWAFVGSPTAVPTLLIAMALVLLTGGLPSPLLSIVRLLNIMSTVTSVEGGIRHLSRNPDVTAIASFLLGIANAGGGGVWSVLVDAWFGSGQYRWARLSIPLPRWILISLAWNIVTWSKCAMTPFVYAFIEFSLYILLLVDELFSALLRGSPSTPAPKSTVKIVSSTGKVLASAEIDSKTLLSKTAPSKEKRD